MDRGTWGLRLFLGGGGLGFLGLLLAAVLDTVSSFAVRVVQLSSTAQGTVVPPVGSAVLAVILASFLASVAGVVLLVGAPEPLPARAEATGRPRASPARRPKRAGQPT